MVLALLSELRSTNDRRGGRMIEISDEERKRRYAICLKCPTRKYLIKLVDFHADFWDCPYSCDNDIEHYLAERKDGGENGTD